MSTNLAITSKWQGREHTVIPFPGNTKALQENGEEEANLGISSALRASVDTGILGSLGDLPYGPTCQMVYVSLLRRLPNVYPGLILLSKNAKKSRCMVTRALNVLEATKVISRHRTKNCKTIYDIADLRNQDIVRECHARIRQLVSQKSFEKSRKQNTKSNPRASTGCIDEPSQTSETRCTDEPGARCMDAPQLGASVHPKGTNKKQSKKQAAAKPPAAVVDAVDRKSFSLNDQLEAVLRKWGLEDAVGYLLNPEHKGAVQVLVDRPADAVRLIEIAMSSKSWNSDEGVGLRVTHLREHIVAAVTQHEAEHQARKTEVSKTKRKARELLSRLPWCDETGIDGLSTVEHRELLEKGLLSLTDDAEVIDVIRKSVNACRRIIANELEIKRLHEEVNHMSDQELQGRFGEVLAINPNLRRFVRDTDPRSWGNRVHIVQHLREERHGRTV